MADTRCRFLELPCELRLCIYGFAVLDARVITVGTAKLTGNASDIVHRQFGDDRSPLCGIPQHCEPVIETQYNAALLSGKATIDVTGTPKPHAISTWTPYQTLSRLNWQIKGELEGHFALPSLRQTSLFVSFPHGLHILQTEVPEFLKQSRSVHVCGSYIPRTGISSTARLFAPFEAAPERLQGALVPDAAGQLSQLVKDVFGINASKPVERLELRIYYPGRTYSTIWSDDHSPICVALRNIAFAKVDMVVSRGTYGNGVHLVATRVTNARRIISTRWYVPKNPLSDSCMANGFQAKVEGGETRGRQLRCRSSMAVTGGRIGFGFSWAGRYQSRYADSVLGLVAL